MSKQKRYVRHIRVGIEPELDELLREYIPQNGKLEHREIGLVLFEAVSALLEARARGIWRATPNVRLCVEDGESHWTEHCNEARAIDNVLKAALALDV